MAEKFKLTENFTPNTEKRAIFRPTENFQFSDEIKKKWATADAESRAKKALSGIAENVSTELKSGIANSKAIAKSKQFNAYVSGNPIPHINPQGGVIGTKKEAEEYAKKATAGDGFEGLSLEELKKRLDSEKEVYERTKGNAVTNVLDFIGSDWFSKNGSFNKTEEYKNQYKALKNAYENRKAAYTDYEVSKKYGVGSAEEAIELLKKRQKETKSDTVKRNLDEEIKTIREGLYGKGSIVKANVKGLTDTGFKQFLSLQAKTMDATLGNVARALGFKNNIFSQTNDYYRNLYEQSHREQERLAKGAGDKYNISGSLGEGISAALPDAAASSVIAILTGGASVAPQLGKAATGIRAALQTSIKSMAKNPFYWSSFVQTYGSDFEDAKSNGANDAVASLYAVLNSSLNAAVEVGGGTGNAGIQSLPEALKNAVGNKSAVMEWVKSALDEGKEEVIQGVITQLNTGLFFDRNKAIYSNTDENAVFNPSRMLQEGAMGAAVGAVLGAGQMTISAISNAAVSSEWRAIGETVEKSGIKADELAEFAAKSLDTETRALGINSLNSKSISTETIGKLYSYACRSISTDILLPENINEVSENFNKIMDGTDSKSIQDIASACFVTKLMQLGIDEESAEYMASGGVTTAENTDLQSTAKAEAEVKADTEAQPAVKESVFDEVSAQKPEYDFIEDWAYTSKGKTRLTDEQKKIAKIGKALGWDVEFDAVHIKDKNGKTVRNENGMPRRADGSIDIKNKRITIDYENKQPIQFIFKHELTHFGESSKLYGDFTEAVEKSKLFEKWLGEKTGKQGSTVRLKAQLLNDIIIIKNADTRERGAIRQFLHDFISYLKKKISGNREISFEISKLEDMFNRMFTDAAEKVSNNSEVKYSTGKTFEEQIDDVINGTHNPRLDLYVSETPEYLIKLNFSDKPILMRNGKISEILNKHSDMSAEIIKQIPKALENPLLVLKSKTHPKDSVVIVTDISTAKGDMIVPVWANQASNYIDLDLGDISLNTNFVASAYGRNTASLIEYAVNNNGILYQNPDIEKVSQLLARNGLQLPTPLKLSDSDITVSQNEQYVNTNIYGEEEKNTSGNQTEKYSINREFEQEYDDWDKINPRKVFTVGETSDVLQKLGFEKRPITWDASKIIKIQAKHTEMTDNVIKQVPNILENPIIVMRSKSAQTRLTMFGEVYVDSKPILAVLELEPTGRNGLKLDEIKIASAYGKDNAQNFINNSDVLYVENDKKRVSNWEMRTGLQLPVGSSLTNSNNSISNNDTSVNTNISENTQNDTEKYSIETESTDKTEDFDKIADLVNRYNNGEISKNEYYEQMREKWREAGEKYGTIPEGENAAEDYGVPNAAKDGAPTRRYVRTVLETGSLTDSMKDQIGAEILQGNFSYSPISDESSIKSADRAIESGEAEKRWKAAIESKNISKKTIAIGERLLADAIKAKDNARVLELSAELSDVLTRAGQVVQSARLLKQMTGVGRLVALQRTVQTLNADLAKRFGDKAPVIQIDENVAQIMAESKTEEEIERAYQEAMQDIADQAQPTLLDKWNAWRYCAMLANPRTHIRNIVGNTIFIPAVRTKDVIATGIERMAQLGNSEVERTKVATVKKEYREFAKNDANSKEVKALLKDQKYDERSQLYKMRRTFKNNVFEFLTSFNGNLLEAEDLLFKNRHYIHALGSFLQARKADLNNVSESLMFEARSYAVKEAQKATFNDESAIANYLKSITQIKDKDTTALKVAKIAIDGVIPFKRTPVNIIRRGIEYSPIGLGKALTAGLYDVKKGKISISEFADGLAAGLTGTGIFAIGLLLSGLGYVNGGFGDDDEDKFKKLNGEQEYSVRVFGKSYTIDWAAPACIPFFIGVETANSFKDGGDVKLSDFTGALWNSLEPVTNLSMLSGIQNTISAAKYSSASETLASIGEDIALSYAMQGIPSLAGSISRTIDPTQRSWYTDKNSSISKFGQEAINNIESKIPGVSYFQAPSIDQWGRIKKRGKLAERLTENFLSPGYYSDIEYDDVNSELKRIIEKTGNTKVVPKKAPTSFNVNKKQKFLTAKEYTTFAAAKGQMSFDYVKEFIETPAYKKLTDEQRIEVISGLYEYAGAKAKTTVSDYDLTKSYKTVTNLERNGTSAVYYYISRALK